MRLQRMHQIWTVYKSSIKWIEELKKENKELNKKEAAGSNVFISNLPVSHWRWGYCVTWLVFL